MADLPAGKDARADSSTFNDVATLRDTLNARVQSIFERYWPTVERELGRLARNRWDAPIPSRRARRPWTLETTLQLLKAPRPTPLDCSLGIANACIHVEVTARVPRAYEAWTVSFRSYDDHNEIQLLGAQQVKLASPSTRALSRALRRMGATGPAVYPLALLPPGPRRQSAHHPRSPHPRSQEEPLSPSSRSGAANSPDDATADPNTHTASALTNG